MLPKTHAIAGLLFCIFCYIFFNFTFLEVSLIFLANIFIDVDHYLFYVFRKKDLNLKNAYEWNLYLPDDHKPVMHIFHCTEFFIVIFLLSIFFFPIIFILIGLIFHSIFDLFELITNVKSKVYLREYFLFRYLIRDKSNYL
jgi:hypothetical protein